jgi:hypothetical protein
MDARRTIHALLAAWLLGACVARDDEPQASSGALLEGISEGASQVGALARALRSGAAAQRELLRSKLSAELGLDAGPIVIRAHHGPGEAARAAAELHRTLVEESGLADAAAALDQLLSADPGDPSGAISGVGRGCASFVDFALQPDIAEVDPPLARLVVALDSSASSSCRADGRAHFDLRTLPDGAGGGSLRVVTSYPDGLTVQPDAGEPFVVSAGGSFFVGLEIDPSLAPTALEAGADYCVRRGTTGTEMCFDGVELDVSGAVSAALTDGACAACAGRYGDALADALAGDRVAITVGTSVTLDAVGTVHLGGDTLTFGGAAPLTMEVGADSSVGAWALIDGEASTAIRGEASAYVFAARMGAAVRGLRATVPLGTAAVVLDGCAARTADMETTTACFVDFEIRPAAPSTIGAIRVVAGGAVTHTGPDVDATYTFTALSAEALGDTLTLDGRVTRETVEALSTASFEGLALTYDPPGFGLGGGVELFDAAGSLVLRADFCPGSTLELERSTTTTTLTGCVSLDSPGVGIIAVGSAASPMTATFAPDVGTLDGPVAYTEPGGDQVAALTFEGWRAEDRGGTSESDFHGRVTGRVLVDLLGLRGILESTSGVEIRASLGSEVSSMALDGDLGASIDTGSRTVTATIAMTGYTATFTGPTIVHEGIADMELAITETVLPSSSMRVTFGDGTTPLSTTFARADGVTTTTLEGTMQLGVGCATLPCAENVGVVLTGVAFRTSEACDRQHPHTGTAEMSGLRPATSALIPALHVRCECDGRDGRDTLLPTEVTMRFTEATPTERRIQIDAARGVCRLLPGRDCNEPGAAWLLDETTCGS